MMDDKNKEILKKHIRETIREMKKKGTTGCSVENLKQCTPTNGLTCSVSAYHLLFPEIAKETAKNFLIYDKWSGHA